MKVNCKQQTGGVIVDWFSGQEMHTKTGKTILDSRVRNQISHVLEDTVEKSTTSRITKYFACVDRTIPIHTKFSLGCSSSTPVFVLWIAVLPVRSLEQTNKHWLVKREMKDL